MKPHLALLAAALGACTGSPDGVQVELSPSVISSLDGTTEVSALVSTGSTPLSGEAAHVEVTYTDRNGMAHDVPAFDGVTDDRGVLVTTLTGLAFDGIGTVTVTAGAAEGAATFSVLDRTPPAIEILPPTQDSKVGPGLPLDVQVHVTDATGVSEVTIDLGDLQGSTRTVAATGDADTTLTFHTAVPLDAQAGPSLEVHALARDLAGNLAAATALTLTVDPAITIAVPPGLTGALLADGSQTQLASPRAIAVSPKDGHLYVADQAQSGACDPSCIWRVDATTGQIDATPVIVGQGRIEGVAFDATGDHLVFSDQSNRIGQLAFDGTAYTGLVQCVDATQQKPQDPLHLLVDATLGILVVDGNDKQVFRAATCSASSPGVQLTNGNFDAPRGIAAGVAGEFYVSDPGRDRISQMSSAGALTTFDSSINGPAGMRWLSGGASAFDNSLLVASSDRVVASTTGTGGTNVVFLRTAPVDLAIATDMFVITAPANGIRGRIYKVSGL